MKILNKYFLTILILILLIPIQIFGYDRNAVKSYAKDYWDTRCSIPYEPECQPGCSPPDYACYSGWDCANFASQ